MGKVTTSDRTKRPVRTTVTVKSDDYAELERIAKAKKVSVAWVIRDAVTEYLSSRTPLFHPK